MPHRTAAEKNGIRRPKGSTPPKSRPQISSDSTNGLEDTYVIDDRPGVAAFIQHNRLRGLLLEARDPLDNAFGEAAIKKLSLVCDDEGFETLFCLVMVPGEMQQARRALRAFDQQWWLARSDRAAGKLNFDFEFSRER